MRIKTHESGYTLWLSSVDTYHWANRPGKRWPGSTIAGNALRVEVDSNGLIDFALNGKQPDWLDDNELTAIVSDHIPPTCRHLWPTWE